MSKTSEDKSPAKPGPQKPDYSGSPTSSTQRNQFLTLALNMSWQLALVVLVPLLGGVQLDKAFDTSPVWTLVGLAVALLGSGLVMWRAMQTANGLPVPKLTDAQRRAVRKSYEEDDD